MENPSYLHTIFISFSCFLSAAALSSTSPLIHAQHAHTFKISLVHRDFGNPNLNSKLEKWQAAIERSNQRLKFLEATIHKARNERDQGSGNYRAPVWSNVGSGSYLTDMTIGTPGRSFTAIVDTGSDLVWRNCRPCISCLEEGPIFDPAESSTYHIASCDSLCQALTPGCVYGYYGTFCVYQYTYADFSSTSGEFSYDTLTLRNISGESHSIERFGFGCSHSTRGDFSGADGLIGLGKGSLSLITQLSIQRFSYCLTSLDDSTLRASPMFLGDSAAELFYSANGVPSTPIITSVQSFYCIKMVGISVGGRRLNIPPSEFEVLEDGTGSVVVDSGTTLTYFTRAIYQVVLEAFERAIVYLRRADTAAAGFDLCYETSGEVPSLTFYFDGSLHLDLPTENYFVSAGNLFCLAISETTGDMSILGNVQQQNYHILYDLANQRMFFVPTNCNGL